MIILAHYFSPDGPGAALAIAADGQPVRLECHGLADPADGIAITPDTF